MGFFQWALLGIGIIIIILLSVIAFYVEEILNIIISHLDVYRNILIDIRDDTERIGNNTERIRDTIKTLKL
jgi:hypothetical protein